MGKALGLPLLEHPEEGRIYPAACRIAARYFFTRGCNHLADAGEFKGITEAINGGLNGYVERVAIWKRFRVALGLGYSLDRAVFQNFMSQPDTRSKETQ